jgi:hypothetical protein
MGGSLIVKFAPALGLGAMSLGTSAWAQDQAPERRLDFGASAVSTYESNLLKLPDAPTFGLRQKREDVRVTPALTLDLQVPLGRQSVFLSGLAGYDFYANHDELNRERIQLDGGGNLRLSTCQTRLGLRFAREQSDLADILSGERLANAETRWVYDGRLSCGNGNGITPSIGYEHERVENSDPDRQTGNYSADTVTGGLGFARPVLGEFAINASYRKGRYDDRRLDANIPERLETFTAGGSFTRKIGSQLTGMVSAGWTKVDPNLPGVRGFSGASWAADLTWTPGTRLQATFGAARQAQQSNLLGISYAIVDDYRVNATYALGDRLQLSSGANYARRSLRDSPLTPGALLREEDKTYRLRAGASYRPSYRLTLSLDASGERRTSSNRLFNYDNFMVALTTRLHV